MLEKLLREPLSRWMVPAGRALTRAGISPNTITVAGTGIVAAGSWLVLVGSLQVGGWVLFAGVVFDMFDGAAAKAAGGGGKAGAFLDSTADRISDGLIFSALAWHLGGTSSLGVGLALAAGVLAFLTSYVRARAEGLGLEGKGGIAERPERMTLVIAGLILGLVTPALAVLVVISLITVVQRITSVWSQARASIGP